jgi:hypothetical protein
MICVLNPSEENEQLTTPLLINPVEKLEALKLANLKIMEDCLK